VTLEDQFYELYRDYFRHAENGRRWNLERDIPWNACNPKTSEKVAQAVEAFMAVEMYLPDYTSKILHLVRNSRGRAWFQANWGYEESKHSMALEEWLIRSGKRTEQQAHEYSDSLLQQEWELPFDTPRRMIIYTTLQELSTQLNYRKLMALAKDEGDEALVTTLGLISRDEAAHFKFFKDGTKVFLEDNRDATLMDIQHVLTNFKMPAIDLISGWQDYLNNIVELGLFSARIFLGEVVQPALKQLEVTRADLKAVVQASGLTTLVEPTARQSLHFLRP
jgi:acyl-[acyl-carrier-protein] desaturase